MPAVAVASCVIVMALGRPLDIAHFAYLGWYETNAVRSSYIEAERSDGDWVSCAERVLRNAVVQRVSRSNRLRSAGTGPLRGIGVERRALPGLRGTARLCAAGRDRRRILARETRPSRTHRNGRGRRRRSAAALPESPSCRDHDPPRRRRSIQPLPQNPPPSEQSSALSRVSTRSTCARFSATGSFTESVLPVH